QLEQRWKSKFDALFNSLIEDVLDTIEEHGELRIHNDLADRIGELLLEHELETVVAATTTITPAEYVRAAKGDDKKWPTDLARIRALWDQWRHTGRLPGRTQKQAEAIKTLYIRRVQQAWQRHGQDFTQGNRVAGRHAKEVEPVNGISDNGRAIVWNPSAFDRDAARAAIEKAFAVPKQRAKTIVETETTRYYNTVRINTYNS